MWVWMAEGAVLFSEAYCNALDDLLIVLASNGGSSSLKRSDGGAIVITSLSQGGMTHARMVARLPSQRYKAKRCEGRVRPSRAKQSIEPSMVGMT